MHQTPSENTSRNYGWPLGASVIFFVLVYVYSHFQSRQLVLHYDAERLFNPYFSLLADYASAGRFMLWNPWSNCGAPDAAYVELGSFSPVTIAFALVTGGGDSGFLAYWLALWGFGAAGLLVLARYNGTSSLYAAAVTIAFMFSGFYVGQATFTSWIYTYSFLPWILWRIGVGIDRRTPSATVQAGALYGLSALAGHPALVIINGLYIAGWTFGRVLFVSSKESSDSEAYDRSGAVPSDGVAPSTKHTANELRIAFGHLTILLLVGIVVLSPAYAAFFTESKGYSERAGYLSRQVAVGQHALPPAAILTMTSPHIVSTDISHWFNGGPNSLPGLLSMYIGSVVPALALCAILHGWKDPWTWWIVFLGLFALACAFGPALPIRGWLYDLCPPTRFFRHSAVFRAYFLFSISVLALRGSRVLTDRSVGAWRMLCLTSSILLAVAAYGYCSAIQDVKPSGPRLTTSHIHFVIAWVSLPLISCVMAATEKRSSEIGKLFVATLGPVLLTLLVWVDAGLAFSQSKSLMSAPAFSMRPRNEPPRIRSIDFKNTGLDRFYTPPGVFIQNQNLYGKVPLLESFSTLNHRFHSRNALGTADFSSLKTSWCEEALLANSVVDSRVWFSRSATKVLHDDALFEAFVRRTQELRAMPLVIHDGKSFTPKDPVDPTVTDAIIRDIGSAPAAEPIEISLSDYSTTEVRFDVQCSDDGWLLFMDRWANGWRASINGDAVNVGVGNFLFRAIPVTKGLNHVEFDYRLAGHPWLVILSWVTLFGTFGHAGLVVISRRSQRRTSAAPASAT
jgi:hypothetical protein